MAEQQKETSSVDSKEGSSLLDGGIGKEFLSSWKSMSMADDDAMDFSFDSVSKGKKKTFNFEKLDMDFNLDGEFDKISSFNVDMSDLDFPCPPTKPAKSMEKKGGESSGAKEREKDGFDFSFDFNKLDSFNLDSNLIKGDTIATTNLNKKGVTSDGSHSEGGKMPEFNDNEHVHASNDSMTMKPLASERVETSKVEVMVGNQGDLGSIKDGFVSRISSSGKMNMTIESRTSLDISKTSSAEEKDQERELPEKTKSTESKSRDISEPPSQSAGQNDSNKDTITDQHTEVFSSGTKVTIGSSGRQNIFNNQAAHVDPDDVKLQLENSSPLQINKLESSDGEAIKCGSTSRAEATNDLQPANNDSSFENNTKADALKKISHDKDIKENQKSTLECHMATTSSEPVFDKVMAMKDKEIKGMQSKFSLKHHSSTDGTKSVSFGCKKIGDMQLRSITKARESFKSNDSECGSKLASDSTPATSELMRDESVFAAAKDDVKIYSNAWEGIVSDGISSGGKFAGNMHPNLPPIHTEVKKSKTMLLETDLSSKDVNMLSSQVNPSSLTDKTARHATQMSVNLQAQIAGKESFQNIRITSIEGNKLSSIKATKVAPALSSFRTSRNVGAKLANKLLPTSIRQKETNCSVNSEQHVGIQGITASKNDHRIDSAENQKLSTPFLKRKTNEVSEADLASSRSLKRLTQSPSKSRSPKECSEKVVEQVESTPNDLLYNHENFGLESSPEISHMEMKLPTSVLVEDNGNVEKAEAYTKELEDICSMLKKKHEEAKELIVRAVVINNNLLMLNHPIYEEKIQKVQKLAFKFMSKGIQT